MTTTTAVKPYREITPDGTLHLNLHPGQSKAWLSKAREILILAGTQGGKTVFSVDWLYREIAERGEGDYLYVTATYPLLQLKVLPEFLTLFRDTLALGKWRDADKVFEFTGSKTRVIFGTATNPESLESATAKAAVLDEAGQKQFRRDSREAVMRRLSIHQGRILYATTPYGLGWLKTEVYDRAQQPNSGIEVINFASTMNPAFPKEEYERAKATMPGWKFRMFYDGRFEKPVGLVYDSFSEAHCKIGRFPIPDSWLWHVGHDFGGVNPAALFYAQDPATGQFYLAYSYKPGHPVPVAEQVTHFKDLMRGRTVVKRVGGSHQEVGWRDDYTAHGWAISEPKILDVAQGIARVYAMHKLNKIMVFDDLADYLDEKLSYSYKLTDKYEPIEEIEDKASYHILDCERYIMG